MKSIIAWLQSTFPGICKFVSEFFKGMNSKNEGHSLKKWLTVGIFWLVFHITEEHTTDNNLEYVLLILVPALLAMAGVYTYESLKKRGQNKPPDENSTPEAEGATKQ